MSKCDCTNIELPRDVIDLVTPFFEAVGGRLYRLHPETGAFAVKMGDGMDVETRIRIIERGLAANSSIYFKDNIPGRDAMTGLVPGDLCYVFDASADATVPYGGAMYMWLPALKWLKCFHGDSPLDAVNMIQEKGGLAVDSKGRLHVDFGALAADRLKELLGQLAQTGSGLAIGSDGKLRLEPGQLAGNGLTASGGRLNVDFAALSAADLKAITADLLAANSGLVTGNDGKLRMDPSALAGSGLSVSGGKLNVDFAAMPEAQMRAVVLAMVQAGGGIGVDSSGRLYVDFASMPTDKFEAMVKSIRVPVWLAATMNLYVAASGVDNAAEAGRGLSAAKPFRTIQYAVDFVCDNYNLSNYNVYINLAPGEYGLTNTLRLGKYSTNTGMICIQGPEIGDGADPQATISITDRGLASLADSAIYRLRRIAYKMTVTPAIERFQYLFSVQKGTLQLNNFQVHLNITGSAAAWENVTARDLRCLMVNEAGSLELANTISNGRCRLKITGNGTGIAEKTFNSFLSCYNGSLNILGAQNGEMAKVHCSGNIQNFAMASAGIISVNYGYGDTILKFIDESESQKVTGRRYRCVSGGRMSVMGAEYFPGTEEGTVEAATYSWYK